MRVFNVRDFGALPDGRDCTEAIQRAEDAASAFLPPPDPEDDNPEDARPGNWETN